MLEQVDNNILQLQAAQQNNIQDAFRAFGYMSLPAWAYFYSSISNRAYFRKYDACI